MVLTSIHKDEKNKIIKYPKKEKEPTFQPKNNIYQQLGSILAKKSVTVDLFITTNNNFELKTISPLSKLTGGDIYYYPSFLINRDSDKLYYDLHRSLTV